MINFARAAVVVSALSLAGCASSPTMMTSAPTTATTAPIVIQTPLLTPGETTAVARAMTDVGPYVETGALSLMSAGDRTKAADAQFNALQFGRPGAPRTWAGDAGAKGSVTVGPFVRVNNLDCRDFTHSVTAGGKTLARKGTACRENGLWSVVSSGTA